ncbi:Hypothetical predicted protein [Octopus vulgaris]|uniref:Helix-turn-helix domain-containing protein n=1 Tax=Octopus vulgaris TaxID=6645 RepID=A0AA36AXI6_OCTVU|nr:Hypothetical predicted protein [Octopus vulgaris]
MGYLEKILYQKTLEKYGNTFSTYIQNNWKRYLDDCFILWDKSIEKLEEFKILLNGINDNIQFTMDHNEEELPFLDVLIKKAGNKIDTDIYYKSTNSKQYLPFDSCHPRHTRINVPFCLARICTIISDTNTQHTRLQELRTTLTNRNYPQPLIDSAIQRALKLSIEDLRQTKPKKKEKLKTLPYISTHNPLNNAAFSTILQSTALLKGDPKMNRILETHTIIKSNGNQNP